MSRLKATLFLVILICTTRTALAGDQLMDEAEQNALRIAKAWGIGSPRFVETDGKSIIATGGVDGIVSVGREFIAQIHARNDDTRRSAVTFVMLHELRHLEQANRLKEEFEDMAKRPLLECEADIQASRAIVLDLLLKIPDFSQKEHLAAASRSLEVFHDTWPGLVELLPASGMGQEHLTKRQRVLALQFGLWRAFGDRLVDEQDEKFRAVADRIFAQAGAQADLPVNDWGREVCERVVGEETQALAKIYFSIEPGDLEEDNTQTFRLSAKNNSYRDIMVSVTFLEGHYPKGQETNIENYVFTDATTSRALVKGGKSEILEAKMKLPSAPEGSDIFIWSLPFLDQALLSAKFLGPKRPPPSCGDNLVEFNDELDGTFLDMARLAGMARNRFSDVVAANNNNFGFESSVVESSLKVRGAMRTEIFITGDTAATVTFYDGPDEFKALSVFANQASQIKKRCTEPFAGIREWIGKDDQLPNLDIKRFTPYARASLVISKQTDDEEPEKPPEYWVYWVFHYNSP
ncbi:hypothetical protein [Mesorhizobium helmanticense]|uniref:Uncharacterized protein n=1 Tax=Mesorhizobium helmanticense TaxID=1776423 RepID=A0A2T4IS97_9HYPH|nr:hypothetical protein [Mesorhizobium helmanticense]PTE08510.1 hypothetical protein C9427_21325 [Mesorhizobium helmanticense]